MTFFWNFFVRTLRLVVVMILVFLEWLAKLSQFGINFISCFGLVRDLFLRTLMIGINWLIRNLHIIFPLWCPLFGFHDIVYTIVCILHCFNILHLLLLNMMMMVCSLFLSFIKFCLGLLNKFIFFHKILIHPIGYGFYIMLTTCCILFH